MREPRLRRPHVRRAVPRDCIPRIASSIPATNQRRILVHQMRPDRQRTIERRFRRLRLDADDPRDYPHEPLPGTLERRSYRRRHFTQCLLELRVSECLGDELVDAAHAILAVQLARLLHMPKQRQHPSGSRASGLDGLHGCGMHKLVQDVALRLSWRKKRHRIGARVVGGSVPLLV